MKNLKVSKLSEPLKLDTLYALSDLRVLVQKSLTEHPSLCMEIRNNNFFDPFYLKVIVLTVLPLATSTQPSTQFACGKV